MAGELQEIGVSSTIPNRIPGHSMGPSQQCQILADSKTWDHTRKTLPCPEGKGLIPERTTKPHRSTEFCKSSGTVRTPKLSEFIEVCQPDKERVPLKNTNFTDGVDKRPDLVELSLSSPFSPTRAICQSLPVNRRVGHRLGSTNRQQAPMGLVGTSGITTTFKPEGNDSDSKSSTKSVPTPGELDCLLTIGQQNSPLIPKERRRDEIAALDGSNISSISYHSNLQHTAQPTPHTGQVQYRSRSPVARLCAPRMASPAKADQTSVCQVGNPPNRPVCISQSPRCKSIRNSGCDGRECAIHRRVLPTMGVQPGMDISTTFPHTKSLVAPEQRQRNIPVCSSPLGKSILEAGPEEPSNSSTIHNTQHSPSSDRCQHKQTPSKIAGSAPGDMEMWGWEKTLVEWSPKQMELLGSSWRNSTKKSYNAAWRRWCAWTSQNKIVR